ncbi:hypothetical protein [Levilactobacillus bambusae]|uniref:CAAX prenyl protease 2/Lysostaphin resistance protein A-like domain-containing protein n=1 Tax=Levilactobacillus bambusae TaxID=2024736 RepID=A0A2V1N0V0_9LACO|nr:hypothetical protein [Levilactobacillus bambusae]PWG00844.1 hypothetical protein DCM90_01310 [Levilactobacillus bambusae]
MIHNPHYVKSAHSLQAECYCIWGPWTTLILICGMGSIAVAQFAWWQMVLECISVPIFIGMLSIYLSESAEHFGVRDLTQLLLFAAAFIAVTAGLFRSGFVSPVILTPQHGWQMGLLLVFGILINPFFETVLFHYYLQGRLFPYFFTKLGLSRHACLVSCIGLTTLLYMTYLSWHPELPMFSAGAFWTLSPVILFSLLYARTQNNFWAVWGMRVIVNLALLAVM